MAAEWGNGHADSLLMTYRLLPGPVKSNTPSISVQMRLYCEVPVNLEYRVNSIHFLHERIDFQQEIPREYRGLIEETFRMHAA